MITSPERLKYLKDYRTENAERLRNYDRDRAVLNPRRAADNMRRLRIKRGTYKGWTLKAYGAYRDELRASIRADKNYDKLYRRWARETFPKPRTEAQIGKERDRARLRARKPLNRIKNTLRLRIRKTLRGQIKVGRTMELTGCSREFLIQWLESQFRDGMTWENYARYWQVDHKIPCAAFDLRESDAQRACFHYSNLQPLTVQENASKSDRVHHA